MKNLKEFIKYLEVEKNTSFFTNTNYELDVREFFEYCLDKNIDYLKITYKESRSYISYLYDEKKNKSSSISSYFPFLIFS